MKYKDPLPNGTLVISDRFSPHHELGVIIDHSYVREDWNRLNIYYTVYLTRKSPGRFPEQKEVLVDGVTLKQFWKVHKGNKHEK
ncbi:MAG: hypothetical protein Q8P81_03530 [Nanoarchaeota archaeon]|nr:hypothetical protein [Nanoarchaeota archaeon]